jgi:tetratricopeptide (TPR) repeat protein
MKTTRFFLLIILTFLFNVLNLSGQKNSKDLISDKYFNCKKYAEALPYYLNKLDSEPSAIELNFKAGVCYWYSRSQKSKAIPYLEKVCASNSGNNESSEIISRSYKLLGDAYHYLYKFDDAISCYEKCGKLINDSCNKDMEEVNGKIEMCRIGKALKGLALSPDIKKGSSPKNVYSNTSSALSPDQSAIIFTFQRENKKKGNDDSRYFENDVKQHSDSLKLRKEKPSPDKKMRFETTIATSFDGQIVLTYRDEDGSATLYTSCLRGNYWTVPEKLDKAINLAGWETNEYISADGSVMYFTSNRKGGYGGNDIYMCKKMETGEWSKAINLGPIINSPYDEEAPFIHPDGKTFYFSSNSHNKDGNYEVFSSLISDAGIYSVPVNVGFPIDTSRNSMEIFIPKATTVKTSKSKRRKHEFPVTEDRRDNYMISFGNPHGISLTLMRGTIITGTVNSSGMVHVEIKDNETEELLSYYLTEITAHGFSFILPPAKNNNVSFKAEGFLFQSENENIANNENYYKCLSPIELLPMEKDAKIILKNVFFENGTAIIRSASKAELNDIVRMLNKNQNLEIEIVGMAECKSEVRDNSKLCSDRAEAVVRYFIEKGIDKKRLNAKGYAIKLKKSNVINLNQWIELRITEGGVVDSRQTGNR